MGRDCLCMMTLFVTGTPFILFYDDRQHDQVNATETEQQPLICRDDPISNYSSDCEVRTCRLSRRVVMFHSFPDALGAESRLTQETAFTYDHGPMLSFMTSP